MIRHHIQAILDGFQESTLSLLKCCSAHVHQITLRCSLSALLVLHKIRLRISGFFRCNGYITPFAKQSRIGFLKFFGHIILIFLLFPIPSLAEGAGKAHKASKAPKEKFLCQPTKKIRVPNKPITHDPTYTDNNSTTKNSGEFEDPYLEKVFIRGVIKDKQCIPIPNASIEIWQEDEYGIKRYEQFSYSFSERYELNKSQYSNFLGIASTTSDNNGNFTFITVVPNSKIKDSKKQSLINFAVSHEYFPSIENQISIDPKLPIKRSNKRVVALKNSEAEKFYQLPTYDLEIVLNGKNKYKTY